MSNLSNNFKHVPIVTTVLIVLNLIAYVVLPFVPGGADVAESWVLTPYGFLQGEWWTLITSMFLHSGIMHIACNMLSLYYLGVMCERIFGKGNFLLLYFLSGIGGGLAFVASALLSGDLITGAVGASGAIFGLFGAYGYLLLRERSRNRLLAHKPGTSDIYSYVAILVVNLVIGFSPGSNIANEAHIGGMICGFVIAAVMYALIVRKLPPARQERPTYVHGSYNQPR